MKFKFSSTIFLLLALAGSTAWYVVYEKQVKSERAEKDKKGKLLLSWPSSEIQELEITHNGGQTFNLKKTGSDWLITSPVEDNADSAVVNSLINNLTAVEEERVVEEAPEKLEPYGLDKPALKIKAFKDVNTFTELSVGAQTQVGYSAYARVSTRPQVLKIPRTLLNAFQKTLFELRNKAVLITPKADLKEVEIQNGTGKFLVRKTTDDKWVLGRESFPIDPSLWGKLLNAITGLRATAVASEKAELSDFGLNAPHVKIVLASTVDKPKETLTLSKKGEKVFAKNDSRSLIYEVDKNVLSELNQGEKELRDLHISNFNRFAVKKIKITRSDFQAEFTKEGSTWSLAALQPNEKVDPNKIEQLLTQLQDAKLSAFTSVDKIEKPSLTIELFEKKDDKEVSVARIEFLKVGSNQIKGKSSTSPLGWTISSEVFKQIDLSRKDFLETQAPKQPEEKS